MITVKRTNPEDKDFQRLVEMLDTYLDEIGREAHCICEPSGKTDAVQFVIVAYSANEPVGCGAIREYSSDTVEIRRMFVLENQRQKGVASMILDELEKWAKELGFNTCILETSDKLPEAVNLYRKKAYSGIGNYRPYECLGSSVCFSKDINQ
jgi:GNAT superfamily N-acetyltransferase